MSETLKTPQNLMEKSSSMMGFFQSLLHIVAAGWAITLWDHGTIFSTFTSHQATNQM